MVFALSARNSANKMGWALKRNKNGCQILSIIDKLPNPFTPKRAKSLKLTAPPQESRSTQSTTPTASNHQTYTPRVP